jgi:ribosome-binding protein aMBF1 (putative translation factor)
MKMNELTNFNGYWEELKENGDKERKKLMIAEEISEIIESIVNARIEKGISQRELAELCGIKQSAIARMETLQAMPRLDTLIKISSSLGVKLVAEKEIPLKIKVGQYSGNMTKYEWQEWPHKITYEEAGSA